MVVVIPKACKGMILIILYDDVKHLSHSHAMDLIGTGIEDSNDRSDIFLIQLGGDSNTNITWLIQTS